MNQQAGKMVASNQTAFFNQQAAAPVPQRKPGVLEYTPFNSKVKIELTVKKVQDFLCKPTKKGFLPTDQDCTKFIMLCQSRGLDPWDGDVFLVGYDSDGGAEFSIITAHQAFLKRAEVHPEYDGMQSGVIVRDAAGNLVDREGDFFLEDDTLLGGWATVFFKGRTHPMHKRLNLSRFHKGNKFWNSNPGGQICKCAEADALRSSFPNLLGGMYLRDEMNLDQQVEGQSRVQVEGSISEIMPNLKPNSPPVGKSQPTPRAKPQPKADVVSRELMDAIIDEAASRGVFGDRLNEICRKFGGERLSTLTLQQADDVLTELRAMPIIPAVADVPETLKPDEDQADQELTDKVNHHLLQNYRLPERKKALAAVGAKDGGPYTNEQALKLLGEL